MDKKIKSSAIDIVAKAFFNGTKAVFDFADKVMISLLGGMLSPSRKEQALMITYLRMFLWMHSITLLKEFRDFQVVVVASRSIFELFMDLNLLIGNKIDKTIDKFYAFYDIEELRIAKDLIEFLEKHPNVKIRAKAHKKFLSDAHQVNTIGKLESKYWSTRKKITHWSGLSIKKRAELLGDEFEAIYYRAYPIMSWYIHAGPSGHINMEEQTFRIIFARHHELAQTMFLKGTVLIAEEFKFDKGIPNFYDNINKLENIPGEILLKEKDNIKSIIEDIKKIQ